MCRGNEQIFDSRDQHEASDQEDEDGFAEDDYFGFGRLMSEDLDTHETNSTSNRRVRIDESAETITEEEGSGDDSEEEEEEEEEYMVQKGDLQTTSNGVIYRCSKRIDDKQIHKIKASFGSKVVGVDEGDGWLRVGPKGVAPLYLPFRIGSVLVLWRMPRSRMGSRRAAFEATSSDSFTPPPRSLETAAATAASVGGRAPDVEATVKRPAIPALASGRDIFFDFDELGDMTPVARSVRSDITEKRPAMEALVSGRDIFFDFNELGDITPVGRSVRSDMSGASGQTSNLITSGDEAAARGILAAPQAEGRRIAIVVNGSRGDIQPIVALALRLGRSHHSVRVLCNSNLVGFCVERGVDAVSVFADCQAVIERTGGMSGELAAGFRKGAREGKKAADAWLHANPNACISAEDALRDFAPHAIIAGTQASGPCLRYESDFGVPVMFVFLNCVAAEIFKDLPDVEPKRPSFFAVSPELDRLSFHSDAVHHTGSWVLDEEPKPSELAEGRTLHALKRFLEAGAPPVCVGWGSMIAEGLPPKDMLALALRSLKAAGRRGVILGGWARLDELGQSLLDGSLRGSELTDELAEFARTEVCFVSAAPHAWLLPQCSCVIHHGGAGTMQAAFLAYRPQVITPIFGDQFASAKVLQQMGAGVSFDRSLVEVSPEELARAMLRAEGEVFKARALGERLHAEDGTRHALQIIDAFLRTEVSSGKWKDESRKLRNVAHSASHENAFSMKSDSTEVSNGKYVSRKLSNVASSMENAFSMDSLSTMESTFSRMNSMDSSRTIEDDMSLEA